MPLPNISPIQAKDLIDQGAIVIDVREPDEFAREHIPGARLHPLSKLELTVSKTDDYPVIFHCRSGNRTTIHAERLAAAAPDGGYVLEGGIEAWKNAGLPVSTDRSEPIAMQRQVQIAAGSLVLLGILSGALIAPALYTLSALVGAGLVIAGVTGTCTMERILAAAPWNRAAKL